MVKTIFLIIIMTNNYNVSTMTLDDHLTLTTIVKEYTI